MSYLSPPQAARELSVRQNKIYKWLDSGELEGINLCGSSQRPRWKISREALNRFLATRSNRPTPQQRKHRPKEDVVEEFYK